MSTLAEIEAAIARLPPEQWKEIRRWMDTHEPAGTMSVLPVLPVTNSIDFLGRQKAVFGEHVLTDSQEILDELRAERH